MNQVRLIRGIARIGHFGRHEDFHLPLVVKWRAGLNEIRLFPTHLPGKIKQRRRFGGLGSLGDSAPTATAKVALVIMTEVSVPNNRSRR